MQKIIVELISNKYKSTILFSIMKLIHFTYATRIIKNMKILLGHLLTTQINEIHFQIANSPNKITL